MLKYLLLLTVAIFGCVIDIQPQHFSTFAQDYTQSNLPQGAKARLGNGNLRKVCFSPDGSQLAVSSSIGLWFYNPITGIAGKKLELLRECILCLSSDQFTYSPDGSTIASVRSVTGAGDVVHLWDVATGEKKTTFTGHKIPLVEALAFSPAGNTIAVGAWYQDSALRLWNARTGQYRTTLTGNTSLIRCIVYSPEGNMIVAGCQDGTICLWDVQTGKHKTTLTGHKKNVCSIDYSPDGNIIASASADETVRLWESATGERIRTLKTDKPLFSQKKNSFTSISYSPDEEKIAAGSLWNGEVHIWDARTGKQETVFKAHLGNITSLEYSPNTNIIVTGSKGDGTVKLWNAITYKNEAVFTEHTHMTNFAYSPDGNTIITNNHQSEFRVWDAQTFKEKIFIVNNNDKYRHGGMFAPVSYSPDGKTIAMAVSDFVDGGVVIRDIRNQTLLNVLFPNNIYEISSIAYSPDGNMIATGGDLYDKNKGAVYLWHAQTGIYKVIQKGHSFVNTVAFSPDGRTITSGDKEGIIRSWDVITGENKVTLTGHIGAAVTSMVYSPNGNTIATGSLDKTVWLWDTNTGEHLRTLTGHKRYVSCIAYSPTGSTIASASADNTIRLWDTNTGNQKGSFIGYGQVTSMLFSPDGQTLASMDPSGTILIWDIIVNYKYKLTLLTHGRRGFLTSPMQSVQVISKSTIKQISRKKNSTTH